MQVISRIDVIFTGIYTGIILLVGGGAAIGLKRWEAVAITLVTAAIYLYFALRKPMARTRALKEPTPQYWRDFLVEHCAFYRDAHAAGKERFERDLRIFMNEFSIEGTQRRETDLDTRLLVASGVVVMLQGRPEWEPPFRDGVVIFPGESFDREFRSGRGQYAGMATRNAPLIITEGGVRHSFRHPEDGYNVVIHEMAHYFDLEDGQAEGVPAARLDPEKWYAWNDLIKREWRKVRRGRSFLREYAGKNEAEFFAVACEAFFETPHRLKENIPEVYNALQDFFNLDPTPRRGDPLS